MLLAWYGAQEKIGTKSEVPVSIVMTYKYSLGFNSTITAIQIVTLNRRLRLQVDLQVSKKKARGETCLGLHILSHLMLDCNWLADYRGMFFFLPSIVKAAYSYSTKICPSTFCLQMPWAANEFRTVTDMTITWWFPAICERGNNRVLCWVKITF